MFQIMLKKGKKVKRITCSGRLLTETTLFSNSLSCELQYKVQKDKRKAKGWLTFIPKSLPKLEHIKVRTSKILGRYIEDGTVGSES